jgi:hypothetical protein
MNSIGHSTQISSMCSGLLARRRTKQGAPFSLSPTLWLTLASMTCSYGDGSYVDMRGTVPLQRGLLSLRLDVCGWTC